MRISSPSQSTRHTSVSGLEFSSDQVSIVRGRVSGIHAIPIVGVWTYETLRNPRLGDSLGLIHVSLA